MIDARLKEWATPKQAEIIDAVISEGSQRKAAAKLNCAKANVDNALKAVRKKAALAGYSPDHGMNHPVPQPFSVKGVSTLYGPDGDVKAQWVKTKLNESQAEEVIKEFVNYLVTEAKGLSPIVKKPKASLDDLLAVYPFGDPHIGMYAWAKECGDNFDLVEAERLTLGAVDALVEAAPPAKTAILLPLGDVFHANDQSNVTPANKHQLDVDSRYPKVIGVGIKIFRHAVLRALEKHEKVIVRIEPGNHDPEAKWALAFALAAYFENNNRVEIDLSPSKFWFYKFGKVLIGSTHGDTVKHEALLGVMASDRTADWGATTKRYWYTGHVHHQSVKEFPGVLCESFRTLAASDAYAAGHGYRAGRDMRCIIHHKEYGEIGRHTRDVEMIKRNEEN
jgi:hypothetical protein